MAYPDEMKPIAHVRAENNGSFVVHDLAEHLEQVSAIAGSFAAACAGDKWAALAGIWHDVGKYQPDFQAHISSASGLDAHIEAPGRVKHAIAGAIHAIDRLDPANRPGAGRLLAYLIAGHHAGLPNWYPDETAGAALCNELGSERKTLLDALSAGIPPSILQPAIVLAVPAVSQLQELHLWMRMLFSCLVDADFLDTEAFMDNARADIRGRYPPIDTLLACFSSHMATRFASADTPVNQLRAEILAHCLTQAAQVPGLFSLTVPTGGGKTLASLGFALHHAKAHGLKRVIYVIPYTSIIEQTADVFRNVFGGIEPSPVIEHHSNFEVDNETAKSRLACENWDAPVVVTTNVQFFESLYAARPSRCRKLHNIADSVVVLDEAQLLPPEHLDPILDVLRQLTGRYRVSVVISTATQPELQKTRKDRFGRIRLEGLGETKELAPDPASLYRKLKRVDVVLPAAIEPRRNWDELAAELAGHSRVLCIVNRRDDAAELWRRLPTGSIHLSARMCGAHRAEAIAEIRRQLEADQPVRVVSTQLVEAGVDLDFPVVYRAMAGLDSIAQAAGRCNREGRLPGLGRVVVFQPPRPSPSGLLLKAEQAAQRVLAGSSGEPMSPANCAAFFEQFYADVGTSTYDQFDAGHMRDLLVKDSSDLRFQFRTAAERFRLIPDQGQRAVFVRWGGGSDLIATLRAIGPRRDLMRKLQRHSVTLYRQQWQQLLVQQELIDENGFLLQAEGSLLYHEQLGLLPEAPDETPESLVC